MFFSNSARQLEVPLNYHYKQTSKLHEEVENVCIGLKSHGKTFCKAWLVNGPIP